MVRVGIPRALLYYRYYPMWKTFFEQLGAEVVLSPPTTKAMVAAGSSRLIADTCLPVKVFCGHVIYLADKCDYMFVPGVRSMGGNAYSCSKLLGLPDVIKAVVPQSPPILDPDIEVPKGKRALYLAIYSLGRHFTWNPLRVKKAGEAAWQTHLDYQALMLAKGQTPPQAIEEVLGAQSQEEKGNGDSFIATIALIGHPYMIYDDYVNHRLIKRLESMGVRVLTSGMVAEGELNRAVATLVGQAYWTQETDVVGAGGYYLKSNIDGLIGIIPFGCGPDSVMIEVLSHYARRVKAKPFMTLTIDEHTAEAGLVTRLEAFFDMILRKKRLKLCH